MPEPAPTLVFVPVRLLSGGASSLWVVRRPDGARTGLAFTETERLDRACGREQARIVLHLSALRTMLGTVGVDHVQLDPDLLVRVPGAGLRAS